MVHDPERCRRHVPGDAAFTLDHERRENSDRVAEFIAPFIAMNTGAQVLARADVLGCEGADGKAQWRLASRGAAHQQQWFLNFEPERGVEGNRARIEGVLDQAHANGTTCSFQDSLHQKPSNTAALDRGINRDGTNSPDGIAFGQKVHSDNGSIFLSDNAVNEWIGNARSGTFCCELNGRKVASRADLRSH